MRDVADSFVHTYMQYTATQESPDDFHLWTAMTLLGAAMGRKCFLNRGFYRIYPNLFTILVAGSSLLRKSTAIEIGIPLIQGIPGILPDREAILVVDGKITPERFIRKLSEAAYHDPADMKKKAPTLFVWADELSVFLTKQSYGEPMIYILTRLFSCPTEFTYESEGKGKSIINDAFVSILAATTPTGFAKGVPDSALEEGFVSRTMLVFQSTSSRSNPWPELTVEEEEMFLRLREMILERSQLIGEFFLEPEAKEWFKDWYTEVYRKEAPTDHRLAGMYGRKHDHILRLGLIWAGSFNRREIYIGDLEAGLQMYEKMEALAPKAFVEMGADRDTVDMNRMRALFRKNGIISHSELLRKMYPCTADRLKPLVETALQSGWIKREPDKYYIFRYVPEFDQAL